MKELIRKLVETNSPSGYETTIREVVRAEVEPLADSLSTDAMGNLIAIKGLASDGGNKIMLSAHMDEIGVIVTHIDEKGFLRFLPMGGVNPRNCVGSRVRFLNGDVGVIHSERLEDPNKAPAFDNLFIDVGAASKDEVRQHVGDPGVFDRPFNELGDRLVSKAMDDRIGVAVMIEALRQMQGTPNQVFFVFSTQEEVGLRGATTAAFGVNPDVGVAVDVTGTGDTPKGSRMAVGLGQGAAIKVRDGGMLSDPRVVDWMVRTAEANGIPYQLEVLEGGTTDARAIQLTRAGVPAGCVSIPTRYIHSPSEMVDYNDVQNCVKLIVKLIENPINL